MRLSKVFKSLSVTGCAILTAACSSLASKNYEPPAEIAQRPAVGFVVESEPGNYSIFSETSTLACEYMAAKAAMIEDRSYDFACFDATRLKGLNEKGEVTYGTTRGLLRAIPPISKDQPWMQYTKTLERLRFMSPTYRDTLIVGGTCNPGYDRKAANEFIKEPLVSKIPKLVNAICSVSRRPY